MTVATFMFGFFVGGCTGVIVAALLREPEAAPLTGQEPSSAKPAFARPS